MSSVNVNANATNTSASATPAIVAAAHAFLATLTDPQRGQAVFDFNDTSARAQWSNFPYPFFPWNGVRMGDLSSDQQELVQNLLVATLSQKGYQRVMASVAADQVLREAAPTDPAQFGSANYFVSVFGTPSITAPWMFRFGGHHMTVNATIVGANIALTPSFPGCQPSEYIANNQTVRPAREVADKGFQFITALDASQQHQAVRGNQAIDLVLGPAQPMRTLAPEGIQASALNADQQALLLDLIGEYVGLLNDEAAVARMAEIRTGLAHTYFAWYGPTTSGSASYFRVQGPALWIEFAPQNGLNHIHSIYRDPTNEYGARWAGS